MPPTPTAFRPEIQGLRAIAVVSVVLFHAWPAALPGGYVGVDVFFVISGFLITGMLVREAGATGRISILGFYGRRVRRLIPAATLVLALVALASPLLPVARWADIAIEIGASALYVENWQLAASAVDYLAAGNAPSPVQHYWSLSIEEQFYVAWPLLLLLIALVATRFRQNLRRLALLVLGLVTVASLAASILITQADPAQAYFVTQTRIWELGLGGLLAIAHLPAPGPRLAEILRAAGLAAIVASCLLFTPELEFPGYAALLPVLGCVAVIAAGSAGHRFGSMRLLGLRPVQFAGDISYSAYLWHWPLLVFAAALTRRPLTALEALGLIVATLVVASLSKHFVEDRFRHPSGGPPWRAVAGGAGAIAVCVVAALALYVPTIWPRDTSGVQVADYPGPAAFLANAPVPKVKEFLPVAVRPENDFADVYGNGCHVPQQQSDLHPCAFGPEQAATSIILAGDSHIASWIPAFEELAPLKNWRVETDTKSGCAFLVDPARRDVAADARCREWGQRLLDRIRTERPDLVVTSMSRGTGQFKDQVLTEAVVATWKAIRDAGIKLVVIADTPQQHQRPVECIQVDPACAAPKTKATRRDAQLTALRLYPDVGFIDMNDAFCRKGNCPVIIGNVVAWRDDNHFTATYSRMLAPTLGERLVPYLE